MFDITMFFGCWILLAIVEFSIRIWIIRYQIRKKGEWYRVMEGFGDGEDGWNYCSHFDINTVRGIALWSLAIFPYPMGILIAIILYVVKTIDELFLSPVNEVMKGEIGETRKNMEKLENWRRQAKKNDMSLEEFVCSPAFKEYVNV